MLHLCASTFVYLGLAAMDAQAQQPPPSFIVHTADGPLPAGPLVKMTEGWNLRLGGAAPKLVDGPDFISLRRVGLLPPPMPPQNVVLLTNGDRIPFRPFTRLQPLHEDTLHIPGAGGLQTKAKDVVALPQAFVSVIWFSTPTGADDPAVALLRLHQARRPRDVVLFKNGDRLEGTVKILDASRGCRLQADGKDIEVPFNRLAAVAFSTELQARPRTKQPFAVATLTGGARLSFAALSLDTDRTRLTGKTLAGPEVSLSLDHLVALDIFQGQAVYLSDLPVKSYEATPFLSLTWPLAKDQAVGGGPLRLGAGWFDKGLGTRGQCHVTYRLDGAYRRFEAWTGLDDDAGPRSRLRLTVLVDGKAQDLKATGERTAKDEPLEIQLDVMGAKELTLRTDFGSFGDVEALATWANARLIKK